MWHACKPSGRGAWRPARSLEISHDVGHMVPGTTRRETRDARGARKMHRPRSHASQLAMSTAGCRAQARGLADDMCAVESARLTARARDRTPGAGLGRSYLGLVVQSARRRHRQSALSPRERVHRGPWTGCGLDGQIRAQIAQREHDVASTADGAVSRTGYRRGRTGLRRSAT